MMRLAEPSTTLPRPKGPSLGSCRLAFSNPVLPWAELAQVGSSVLLPDRMLHRQASGLPRLITMGGFSAAQTQQLALTLVCWFASRRDRYSLPSPYEGSAL